MVMLQERNQLWCFTILSLFHKLDITLTNFTVTLKAKQCEMITVYTHFSTLLALECAIPLPKLKDSNNLFNNTVKSNIRVNKLYFNFYSTPTLHWGDLNVLEQLQKYPWPLITKYEDIGNNLSQSLCSYWEYNQE